MLRATCYEMVQTISFHLHLEMFRNFILVFSWFFHGFMRFLPFVSIVFPQKVTHPHPSSPSHLTEDGFSLVELAHLVVAESLPKGRRACLHIIWMHS